MEMITCDDCFKKVCREHDIENCGKCRKKCEEDDLPVFIPNLNGRDIKK